MSIAVHHIGVSMLLFMVTTFCIAQSPPNKFDRKGNKHGVWKDSLVSAGGTFIETGRYSHGQRRGEWNAIVTNGSFRSTTSGTYVYGKKNGWWVTYQKNMLTAKPDSYLVQKDLYSQDFLVECIRYTSARSALFLSHDSIITIIQSRTYFSLTHDTITHVQFFHNVEEDSGMISSITRWTKLGTPSGLIETRGSFRPAGALHAFVDTYYRSGAISGHTDSLLWLNKVESVSYYENGRVKAMHHHLGPLEIKNKPEEYYPYHLFIYYGDDSAHYTREINESLSIVDRSAEFDSNGIIMKKSYSIATSNKLLLSQDTFYSPPGILNGYSHWTYIWVSDFGSQNAFGKEYDGKGKLRRSTGVISDSVNYDSLFYENGNVRETNLNFRNGVIKKTWHYENGQLQKQVLIDTSKGTRSEEEYDEAGRLIKHK